MSGVLPLHRSFLEASSANSAR